MSEEQKLEFLCIHQGLHLVGLLKVDDKTGANRARSLGFSVTKMVPDSDTRAGKKV